MRIGQGFDVHALEEGVPLVLGGVTIAHPYGLAGDSDGDVLCHAIIDAVFGAVHLGDMGTWFRADDPTVAGAYSLHLLERAWAMVRQQGFYLENLDATIVAEAPRLAPYRQAMEEKVASVLGVAADRVSVKAKTTDKLGFLGRKEGMAALAVVSLSPLNALPLTDAK
jgi:2-C-methyl-D-erythritol 2,4-cyclodiphosphate synthase